MMKFERIMGCTAAELLGWLPRALPGAVLEFESNSEAGRCRGSFEDGQLLIEWRVLAPRQIALLRLPRLEVCFTYSGLEDARRQEVQTYFDRATQRGGG
ncbi:MAG TPA: hypothetical protein VMV87_04630 [Burkholderiales bacterium]|nr:hypothetical protein [Burkholderiales bacterium]